MQFKWSIEFLKCCGNGKKEIKRKLFIVMLCYYYYFLSENFFMCLYLFDFIFCTPNGVIFPILSSYFAFIYYDMQFFIDILWCRTMWAVNSEQYLVNITNGQSHSHCRHLFKHWNFHFLWNGIAISHTIFF